MHADTDADTDADADADAELLRLDVIARDKFDALTAWLGGAGAHIERKKKIYDSLLDYRLVRSREMLRLGAYVRWIRLDDDAAAAAATAPLSVGGFLAAVEESGDGDPLLCVTLARSTRQRVVKLRFRACIVFQKLSTDEKLLIAATQHLLHSRSPSSP